MVGVGLVIFLVFTNVDSYSIGAKVLGSPDLARQSDTKQQSKTPIPLAGRDTELKRTYYANLVNRLIVTCKLTCGKTCSSNKKSLGSLRLCEDSCVTYYNTGDKLEAKTASANINKACSQ